VCYKIGSWLVEGLFPRRRRPVYADLPVREHYQSPVPPAPPRPIRSCRRGGGGGAFLTLLVVVAVVVGFSNFTRQKRSREQARADQGRAQVESKRVKISRSMAAKQAAATVVVVDQRDAVEVAVAAEEIIKAPELPEEEDRSGWILGLGKSHSDAVERAYDHGYDKALAYLHEHLPGVQWTPSREYVTKFLLTPDPQPLPQREFENYGTFHQARVRLEVKPAQVQDILRMDRQDRVEQRMTLLAKVLGAVVLFFAAVFSYIRIDEYSKGYLTGWLRVAGIVTAAAAGLFLFMR
jgi:hypothetical protein